MKIGTIKTIVREELSKLGDLPKWIDPFLQALNQFITQAGQALKGGLTFQDNFLCRVKSVTLTHGVALEVNPDPSISGKLRVKGVACFDAGGLLIDAFGWSQLSNGNVSVTIYYKSGTSSNCNLIIFLG